MTKNITLKVYSWHSPDVAIESWEPESLDAVRFLLEVEIGEDGAEGKDLFDLIVATPEGLRRRASKLGIAERATLVVSEYSWAEVKSLVEEIVRRCESPTWAESVLKLQRYFRWEYEDYVMEK